MAERNIEFDGVCKDSNQDVVEGIDNYADCMEDDETNTWNEEAVMTLVEHASIHANTAIVAAHCDNNTEDDPTECATHEANWVAESGGTTVSWPVTMAFYNLPLIQTPLAGKSFTGRVEVANVEC